MPFAHSRARAVMSSKRIVTLRRGMNGTAKSHRRKERTSVGPNAGEAVRPFRLQIEPQRPVVRTATTRASGGSARQTL